MIEQHKAMFSFLNTIFYFIKIYGTNGPLSPRTRSVVKQEIDEEVSFV